MKVVAAGADICDDNASGPHEIKDRSSIARSTGMLSST